MKFAEEGEWKNEELLSLVKTKGIRVDVTDKVMNLYVL